MIAVERREGGKLDPTRQQSWSRGTIESSDIRTDVRDAADAEVEHHLRGQAQMVPGSRVVPRPGEAVALSTRVCGASQHKRPLVGTQFEQAIVSGAGVLEPDYVMDLGMRGSPRREARFFDAMNRVERHGLVGSVKHRGFVHVVPKTRDPILHEIVVEI